ncbi:UNVERIFIED_CONTAM: hypothetical protein Sradi_5242400 [Sesamum radiatum]|uniref:TraB domain-containing protein n=1 Tax=Sesamum radiatum TaxID=300843 RepID=A0AAW2LMY9_SESRA
MHRLNRLNSAAHRLVLLTATPRTTNPKRFLRLSPPFRSPASVHSPLRRVMDPSSPAATTGIDDFVHVGEGDQISGENSENLSENEGGNEGSDGNDGNSFHGRKVLPPEFSRSTVKLTCDSAAEGGECDVYLVGTAHVSTESCREVQAVIDFLKPQVVFLELCSGRIAVLTPQNLKVPTIGEMVEMWKKNHNPFGILYSWFLAKVASKLEVLPGAEFRVAYEEATKYGAKVILGDRPVQLKEMDDIDMLTLVIQEMSKQFPTLMETLVHERDQYMSATLLRTAREHNSVVAVVGKGHLPGIQKYWKQPVEVKQLLTIPSQKDTVPVRKILATIGVTVAGVAIISGLYLSSRK